MEQPNAEHFRRLLQRFAPGARLIRCWALTGGVSAQVTALEYATAGGELHRVVVRCHGAVDRTRDPQIAEHEFRLLAAVTGAGVAAPRPLFVGDLDETPVLVVSFVEGERVFDPPNRQDYLQRLAAVLAQVHAVDPAEGLGFLPLLTAQITPPAAALDESMSEGLIRGALASMPFAHTAPVLLHGDFWPGNVLWRDGAVAAVLDWEDAALGDPLADVANARLEILWALGEEAMTHFTRHYQSITNRDLSRLAYWDLRAALRPAGKLHTWGLDAHTEERMRRRHRYFVQQALKATDP